MMRSLSPLVALLLATTMALLTAQPSQADLQADLAKYNKTVELSASVSVYWDVENATTLSMAVKAKTTGWAAVSFKTTGLMLNSFAIIGSVTGATPSVDEYQLTAYSAATIRSNVITPRRVTDLRGQLVGTDTTIFAFKRPLETSDYTIDATKSIRVLWAIGGAGDKGVNSRHTNRGSGTINLASGSATPDSGVDQRDVHGTFMLLSWGVLLPLGICFARFMKPRDTEGKGDWFSFHRAFQSLGWVCMLIGFAVAVDMTNDSGEHFSGNNATHKVFGLIVFTLGTIIFISGLMRPHKGAPNRAAWGQFHRNAARGTAIVALLVLLSGRAAHETISDAFKTLILVVIILAVLVFALLQVLHVRWSKGQRHASGVELADQADRHDNSE